MKPGAAAIALLLLLQLTGCFLAPREERRLEPPLIKPDTVDYREVTVQLHDLTESLEVRAYFQSASEQRLFFRHAGGRLSRYYCELGDTVRAGQVLAELEVQSLKSAIAAQRLLLEKAQIQRERAKTLGADKYQLRLAQIDVELARLKLRDLERDLSESTIVSPIDGVVVYKAGHAEGDPVKPYSTIIRVADPSKLRLVYSGPQAAEFIPGMPVEVSVGGKTVAGQVLSTPKESPSEATTAERNKVVFSLETVPPGVTRGDIATVRALLWSRPGVVAIPNEYLHTYKGKPFVNALVNGVKRELPVKIGLQTATMTEIVEGLREGDKILW